jgi:hypothetical protein
MSDCGHENHGKPGRNCGCVPSPAISLLPKERDYCGCCGREIRWSASSSSVRSWCDECVPHLGDTGPAWERTYFALHRKTCPFSPRFRRAPGRTA